MGGDCHCEPEGRGNLIFEDCRAYSETFIEIAELVPSFFEEIAELVSNFYVRDR